MRFMMFMIPRVYQPDAPPGGRAEEGDAPPAEAVARIMKFNEALVQAGALIALAGLHPRSGARVSRVSAASPKRPTGLLPGRKKGSAAIG
jgi:hypothetical protein